MSREQTQLPNGANTVGDRIIVNAPKTGFGDRVHFSINGDSTFLHPTSAQELYDKLGAVIVKQSERPDANAPVVTPDLISWGPESATSAGPFNALIEKLQNTRGNMFRTFADVDALFGECISALSGTQQALHTVSDEGLDAALTRVWREHRARCTDPYSCCDAGTTGSKTGERGCEWWVLRAALESTLGVPRAKVTLSVAEYGHVWEVFANAVACGKDGITAMGFALKTLGYEVEPNERP